MGLLDYFKNKKKEKLPLIARVNLAELQKQREENMELGEVSILAKADYTKRIPTIRLCYISMEKFRRYGTNDVLIGTTFGVSSPFRLPNEMSIADAFKVVSYLSDKVETENNIEPASEESVAKVSDLLTDYGFQKVESKERGHFHEISEYCPGHKIKTDIAACKQIDGVVDLFSVGGDFGLFKRSEFYPRYFNWYAESVSEEDIVKIYKDIRKDYLLEFNRLIKLMPKEETTM